MAVKVAGRDYGFQVALTVTNHKRLDRVLGFLGSRASGSQKNLSRRFYTSSPKP